MKRQAIAFGLLLLAAVSASAQEDGATGNAAADPEATSPLAFDLHELIREVADDIGKEFIIDPRLPPAMRAGYRTDDDVDYDTLLAILRMLQFATIEKEDYVLVVPEQNLRAEPTRLLQEDDPRVSDHEYVTRVIQLPDMPDTRSVDEIAEAPLARNSAALFVPVLRPLMPTYAMLGAVPNANSLIVADRYDNVRRITAIINEIVEGIDD
jgi:general secretion pathway protein D